MKFQVCEGTYINGLSSCSSAHFLELELNLVPISLKFSYRGTELDELSSSCSTDFLDLVPFKKELSQPWNLEANVVKFDEVWLKSQFKSLQLD